MNTRQLLTDLAAKGHSRTSAHKAAGISWHTFRLLCADHPDIEWRKTGQHSKRRTS